MNKSEPLERFVDAQTTCYEAACAELKAGKKTSHWMWFIFPQMEGLGQSAMAKRYALHSRQEIISYLNHPVLGPRLLQCVGLMLEAKGKSAYEILGTPDDLKFRSCMTMFAVVSDETVFKQTLTRFYDGKPDPRTLKLLRA